MVNTLAEFIIELKTYDYTITAVITPTVTDMNAMQMFNCIFFYSYDFFVKRRAKLKKSLCIIKRKSRYDITLSWNYF